MSLVFVNQSNIVFGWRKNEAPVVGVETLVLFGDLAVQVLDLGVLIGNGALQLLGVKLRAVAVGETKPTEKIKEKDLLLQ